MPHHSAAPGLQQPGALTSAAAAPDTEKDGGAEQPSEQEGKAQGEADPAVAAAAAAAMAAMAAAEYEGDRKLAWMMWRCVR